VRYLRKEDLNFLTKPPNPVYIGKVRSGSKIIDVDVFQNGEDFFTHHVLIPATTGRGKSNFVKVMLWSALEHRKFGILVLDPHDEYYGKNSKGLKDHLDAKSNLVYYSSDPPIGANTLVINLRSIKPEHFSGIVDFTDAQYDAITIFYREFRELWIEKIILGVELESIHPRTLSVLQRKFKTILGISVQEGQIRCISNVFSDSAGDSTAGDMVNSLENGKIVVVDTSNVGDEAELLIGSIIANKIFSKYQAYKSKGELSKKPTVSIVIEEAPRVLGSDRLASSGENIFSTIAREGRKFRVGLIAITQLTSVIPRTILTNMNTKIILGNEMATERHAIIESAAQDLAMDERNIASLDKGEAIISSIFTKFAVPVYIPLFEEIVKKSASNQEKDQIVFEE
jgi:DNA helicase HerA-like ATPase